MTAQTKRYPFDPVPFFSRLIVGQEWTSDMYIIPSNARATYADSILQNKYVMAVTMHLDDVDSAGWKLTLYFDADRWGTLRFMRAYGRCDIIHPDERSFVKLEAWIDTLMKEKVSEKKALSQDKISWQWTQKEEYRLTFQREILPEDAMRYFLVLDRKEEGSE